MALAVTFKIQISHLEYEMGCMRYFFFAKHSSIVYYVHVLYMIRSFRFLVFTILLCFSIWHFCQFCLMKIHL